MPCHKPALGFPPPWLKGTPVPAPVPKGSPPPPSKVRDGKEGIPTGFWNLLFSCKSLVEKARYQLQLTKKSDHFKGGSCQPDPGSWVGAKGCAPAANTVLLNHRAQQIPFPDHQTLPKEHLFASPGLLHSMLALILPCGSPRDLPQWQQPPFQPCRTEHLPPISGRDCTGCTKPQHVLGPASTSTALSQETSQHSTDF